MPEKQKQTSIEKCINMITEQGSGMKEMTGSRME
jgi:hypothetical protein